MKFRKVVSLIMAAAMGLSLMTAALPVLADSEEEAGPEVTLIPVTEITFDGGSQQGIYSTGNSKARLVSDNVHSGGYALEIYDRDQNWNAAEMDLTGRMTPGNTYRFSAWVYQETGENRWFQLSVKYEGDPEGTMYDMVVQQEVASGVWTYLIGKYTVPDVATSVYPYVEQITDLVTFRVDDISIVQSGGYVPDSTVEEDIVSLKDVFAQSGLGITVGTTIGDAVMSDTTGRQMELIKKHFDSVALENQLKASYVLDHSACVADLENTNLAPALNFSAAKPMMDFAKENGLTVKAQCLAWFSMTPDWFFHVDYDVNKALADRETMLARLDSYIKGVLAWHTENYPGVVDTWIVVNEAFDGDSNTKVRDDNFFKTIGEDYVARVFEIAHKYRPEGVTYLYNDYNIEASATKLDFALNYLQEHGVIENGWVDGIGFQTHVQMGWPGTGSIIEGCKKVADLGLSAQITELDIRLGQSEISGYGSRSLAFRAQQRRVEEIVGAFLTGARQSGLNLTNITWWGLTDSYTWLTSVYGEQNYPLLFDENNKAKPAFYGMINAIEEAAAAGETEVPVEPTDFAAGGKLTGDNGHQGSLTSDRAVDGNEEGESRWAGKQGTDPDACDDFWWIDFGEEVTFNTLDIKWEDCYATQYTVEVKDADGDPTDNEGWTVVQQVSGGSKGWKTVHLEEDATGRYMRINITRKANSWGVSFYELKAYWSQPYVTDNMAYGKPSGDNGHDGGSVAGNAFDEDESTRWAGVQTHSNTEPNASEDFLWVDLKEEKTFNNIQLLWEQCHGVDYTIEIQGADGDPTDNEAWNVVSTVTGNSGSGWREVIFEEPITARYVRIHITKKANSWGVSLYEVCIYNDEALNIQTAPPVYIGEDTEEFPGVVELPKDPVPGDLDGDGFITAADLTVLARGVAQMEELPADVDADMDGNGEITAADLTVLARIVAGIA